MTSPRTKTLLWRGGALAVMGGLPILLLVMCFSNIMQTMAANDTAGRQATMLAQIIAKLATHRERGLTPEEIASLYLGSKTSTLARAEIQARATKLVEAAGGRLAEAQLTGTPEQEVAGTVAIQLALDIDNKGLFDLLYTTESGLPLLTVTNITTQTGNGRGEDLSAGRGRLHVDMTMQGQFRRASE